MSYKPENRYQNEEYANEHIKYVLLQYELNNHLIHQNDIYAVHNVYDKTNGNNDANLNGADITVRCKICNKEINYDIKCAPKLRDNNYNTVLVELGTYAYNLSDRSTYWQKGWVYSLLCQKVCWVVPLDDGYEKGNMTNYVLYICDKANIKNKCNEFLHEDEVVPYCENEDMWIRRNKWGKYKYQLDDLIPLQMTYELKTGNADGLLLVTLLSDIITSGIIVINDEVKLISDNYELIERLRQKECLKYRMNKSEQ